MIGLLLHAFGLAWLFGTLAYWVVHVTFALGAVLILFAKGYVSDVRGVLLAALCAVDWGTGLFASMLLRELPIPADPDPLRVN